MNTVDIIIPTYKPGEEFISLIEKLENQSVEIQKIWIINTEMQYWNAFPEAEKLLQRYHNIEVRHIEKKQFDHAATRQMAADLSDADIFVMMTMDAIPKDDMLIEALIKGLTEDGVAVTYARQLAKKDAGLLESYTRVHNYPENSLKKTKADLSQLGIKTYFCSDVCAAYNRQIFKALGGYVESAIFNEDMIYAAKAIQNGYAIYYAAEAGVYHSHNYSGLQQLKRNFDLGVSQAMHPEVFADVPSEGAGIAMVKKTAGYVLRQRKPWLLIKLVWQSGCKYIGYRLGKGYRKLPKWLILWFTDSKAYWKYHAVK